MHKRNIVFVANRRYLHHLAVALVSLLENNSDMNIYIINTDISADDWQKLNKIIVNNNSILIDAKINDKQVESLITHCFTKTTYYKIFIPDVVKGDKALYLDPDIVVTQSIDDLYNTEISDTFIAAVDNMDNFNHYDLEMESSARYFNAGVMLINLKYWRAHNVKEKVIEFINRKPEVINFPDQDGFNTVINGKWLELHPKYNLHTGLLYKDYAQYSLIKEAIDNPVIIHYTGSSKPCQFMNNHPYKYLYWKYIKMTPYKYFVPEDLNVINVAKRMVPAPLKQFIKKILKINSPIKDN